MQMSMPRFLFPVAAAVAAVAAAKAEVAASGEEMSAEKAWIFVVADNTDDDADDAEAADADDDADACCSSSRLACSSVASDRPRMTTCAAPAWTKAVAIWKPMPRPPPVTSTVLPAAELRDCVGEVYGWAVLW